MSKKKGVKQQNFVAKYARQFNKAAVHQDQTKYNRKRKHRNHTDYDAFFMLDKSVMFSL
jgi:hypothetical protein